jgi:ketosteroid isomerase-like protein
MLPRKPSFGPRLSLTLTCIAMTLAATGCNQAAPPDTRKSDEETIRALDAQWSKTAGAHDLEATVAFYADNAVLLPPDEAAAMDKASIRASWAGTFSALDTISWEVTRIEVARSGDLAYLTGKWKATAKGPKVAAIPSTGKLLEVWEKQPDGKWKCVADTYNNDAPATVTQAPRQRNNSSQRNSVIASQRYFAAYSV